MKSDSKNAITVEIVGGLGNQLFIFIAGLYLSRKLGTPMRAYLRPRRKGESAHTSSIQSLTLGLGVESNITWMQKVSMMWRFNLRRLALVLRLPTKYVEALSRIHIADSIGTDTNLLDSKPGYFVSGYFQSHEYFYSLKNNNLLPEFSLANPSEWFLKELESVEIEKPIVVHIRRGDYLLERNSFLGALSSSYYQRAIETARRRLGIDGVTRPIWIFSDDPKSAKEELGIAKGQNLRVIYPPDNSDPAESMILMSRASAIVISNSTFSWWAAALSGAQVIVAPSKWFRNREDPKGLIPQEWEKVESKWIN